MGESTKNNALTPQVGISEERHLAITRGKPPDEWDALLLGGEEMPETLGEKDPDAFFNDPSSLESFGKAQK